jgi:hypothetical protein
MINKDNMLFALGFNSDGSDKIPTDIMLSVLTLDPDFAHDFQIILSNIGVVRKGDEKDFDLIMREFKKFLKDKGFFNHEGDKDGK